MHNSNHISAPVLATGTALLAIRHPRPPLQLRLDDIGAVCDDEQSGNEAVQVVVVREKIPFSGRRWRLKIWTRAHATVFIGRGPKIVFGTIFWISFFVLEYVHIPMPCSHIPIGMCSFSKCTLCDSQFGMVNVNLRIENGRICKN